MQTFTFEEVQAIAKAAARVQSIVSTTGCIISTEAVSPPVPAGHIPPLEDETHILLIAFVGRQGDWQLDSVKRIQ